MKRLASSLSFLAAAVLGLTLTAGCGKKGDDAAGKTKAGAGAVAADCDKLGQRTVEQSMAQTPPGTTDEQRRALQAMSDEAGRAIAARCKADGWSADAVACGLTAGNTSMECDSKLTAEQKKKVTTDVQAIFAKSAPGLAAPPPPPAPPSAAEPPPAAPPVPPAPPAP